MIASPEPFLCPPLEDHILNEYENLMRHPEVPTSSLRAWVREADKACRANERMLTRAYGSKEVK